MIYRAIQGLKSEKLDNGFVRRVYELKLFMLEGEFIPVEKAGSFSDSLYRIVEYISASSIEKLFNFKVEDSVFAEMEKLSEFIKNSFASQNFFSSIVFPPQESCVH